jgi:hypothetical protein
MLSPFTFPISVLSVTIMSFFASIDLGAEHIQACGARSYRMPDRFSVVCSSSWQFHATCTGQDMWDQWKVPGSKDAFIRPWHKRPIIIIGYELVKIAGARDADSWFMVGSKIQPDAMLWLAPGQTHAKVIWPSGLGQAWPAAEEADQIGLQDILDLHGWCPKDEKVTIILTLYFTPEWE